MKPSKATPLDADLNVTMIDFSSSITFEGFAGLLLCKFRQELHLAK